MSLPETVSTQSNVTVSVASPLRHTCPFVDEVDDGFVDISWRCNGASIELHSLRAWLDQWSDCDDSHEEITDAIVHTLGSLSGIKDVSVVTYWTTAGMSVSVTGGDGALLREPVHAGGE